LGLSRVASGSFTWSQVSAAGSERPIGAKPFEPVRPERLSKAETRDDGFRKTLQIESSAVRSAPGRSEREAGGIAAARGERKGAEWELQETRLQPSSVVIAAMVRKGQCRTQQIPGIRMFS
jgi:hypothetical protein